MGAQGSIGARVVLAALGGIAGCGRPARPEVTLADREERVLDLELTD